MKVAFLVCGLLRNFQMPMANWIYWPRDIEAHYFLITWSKTKKSKHNDNFIPSYNAIQEASSILNFKRTLVVEHYSNEGFNIELNGIRMINLWSEAAKMMKSYDERFDAYVILRPDAFYIPNLEAVSEENVSLDCQGGIIAGPHVFPFDFSDVDWLDTFMGLDYSCLDFPIFLFDEIKKKIQKSNPQELPNRMESGHTLLADFAPIVIKSNPNLTITRHVLSVGYCIDFICRREGDPHILDERALNIERQIEMVEWLGNGGVWGTGTTVELPAWARNRIN